MAPINRQEFLDSNFMPNELYQAERAWFVLFNFIKSNKLKDVIAGSGSLSEAWKTINESFSPQTPGREIDLFSDLVNASMPTDGNPISLYAHLSSITFHQTSAFIKDPTVVEYIHRILLHMTLFSTLPKTYEAEMRAIRVDASKSHLDPAHVKRVISDRNQFLERAKKKPRQQ